MSESQSYNVMQRVFAIIDALSLHPRSISLTDLSISTGIPKSSTHRILQDLISNGYVVKDKRGSYSLSFKVCELSYRVLSGLDLLEIATPIAKRLCNHVNETVHLLAPSEIDIVYLRKDAPIQSSSRTMSYIGMRRPMYCTAAGKSILAMCSADERLSIWKKSHIKKYTFNTIVQYSDLQKDLQLTRTRGYAIDDEENEVGIKCIAGAILNNDRTPIGAVSITAPAVKMTDETIEEYAVLLKEAVETISLSMGYGIGHI